MGPVEGAYARSGVDQLLSGNAVAALVEVLSGIRTGRPSRAALESGHYANVLKIDDQRGLALSCDSVGSKVILCEQLGRYDTIGIDLWGMNANDVICVGADPIALLDYIAVEEANPEVLEQIALGLREGAEQAGAEIPGGELAVLPGRGARPPVAARLRPGRVLRGPGRPRLHHHRRPHRARRHDRGHPLERHPLERPQPGARRAHGPRRGARRRPRRWATCCSSRP